LTAADAEGYAAAFDMLTLRASRVVLRAKPNNLSKQRRENPYTPPTATQKQQETKEKRAR
jgi:hypothetical protein